MESRLEVLRNGQDVINKNLLYNVAAAQQQQQSIDADNESNKSDSWVELANPSSRTSVVSMAGGDSCSVVVVDGDGIAASTDAVFATTAGPGGSNGSPFSRLSAPLELIIDSGQGQGSNSAAVHYYSCHGFGRRIATVAGIAGLTQGTKRTVEWLESYNSRPETQRIGVQAPSPMDTELSTPPNSLVGGLDIGELTQSSFFEDDDELSVADNVEYACKCQKSVDSGQKSGEKERWTLSGFLGLNGASGHRAMLLYLVTNLMTLAIGFAIGLTIGRKSSVLSCARYHSFFNF